MMCDRCSNPIGEGELYEEIPIDRPTGAGVTVVLHKELCKRPHANLDTSPEYRRVRSR